MEHGVVVEIDGGRVLVEAGPNSSCCDCAAARSCLIVASGSGRRIWMENTPGAGVGDEVLFFIEERALIAGSVVLFAVPAIMLVAGAVLGSSLSARFKTDPERSALAGGIAGLIMSYVVMKIVSAAVKKRDLFVPRITEVTGRRTN